MSTFGGPEDMGVSPSEGLALCEPSEVGLFPDWIFLPENPPGTSGLARRLNPESRYCAARWDYDVTPRDWLQSNVVIVRNPKTGAAAACRPIDWGPNETTGRIADLSPGMAELLELKTDDHCEMVIPLPPQFDVAHYGHIVISSGHGLYVRGAAGILDEVDEARNVVAQVAIQLGKRGVNVKQFHDNTSTTQNQNLQTICNFHNAQTRDLDVSVHFNAFEPTDKPMGTEVLYVSQNTLANQLSSAIAAQGFVNRGGKKRTDLYFLNHTSMPAVLLETCFVDSSADANIYGKKFDEICKAIATVLSGKVTARPKAKKRK
jgi:N-acetylmuramoyl-L-alanine amidase